MSLAKISVKNSILVNLLMIVVFIAGIKFVIDMPKEEMPAIDFGQFVIGVNYPGVSPQEIETLITNKVEDEISDVDNLDYISSTSSEGRSVITVVFKPNADIDQAWNDINTEMDKINDLPEDAMDPWILRINMKEVAEICNISLSGNFSGNSMRTISENLQDRILEIDNVSKIDIQGNRNREIWVEADANKLNEYGLNISDLQNAIQFRNRNIPSGSVNLENAEFIVRTIGEFNSIEELRQVQIRVEDNGSTIKLKDVADVSDTLQEIEVISKLNGRESVTLQVFMKEEGNIIKMIKEIRNQVNKYQKEIEGLQVTVRNDASIDVKNSLSTLATSSALGIVLVFISLWLFVGWRNAFLAALGIPFSFFLTFILMQQVGITMNNLSLFALILVLGMIVDDAIVVLENVHRHIENGVDPHKAAIIGTNEITWPVITAVLTTIVAFLPMLIMKGMMGKFMRVFPIVVSLALMASLLEALVILPSHIAEFQKKSKTKKKHKLLAFILKKYHSVIIVALKHRWKTLILAILSFLLAIFTIFAGLRFEFFPSGTPKTIVLKLKTPIGTQLEETNKVVSKVENYILNSKESEDIEAIVSTVGQQINNHRWEIKGSNAEMKIDFKDIENMKFSLNEIKNSIRKYVDKQPDIFSFRFSEQRRGPPTGEDVELRIKGKDFKKLKTITKYIEQILAEIPGVSDIEDSFTEGKDEVQILPDYNKLAQYGINVSQIGSLLRTASFGSTISEFRGSGIDEYDIILKYKEEQIDDLDELKNILIRTKYGSLIKLSEIAKFNKVTGMTEINHRDKKRIISITANTTTYIKDSEKIKRNPSEVTEILLGNKFRKIPGKLTNFESKFPGYTLEFGGVEEERDKSFKSLFLALGIALLFIFGILAALFKSYFQPLIVMSAIPFALIGVVFGLFVTNQPFSLNSLIAFIALAGVVVNDSLILVDFVNKERDQGIDRWNSLINAGMQRLRPILLTTTTTVFGVMPMILSTSESSVYWKPMAVSIAFGLMFATMLTLIVIPVLYSLVDSLFGKLGLTRFKTHISFEEAIQKRDN